jgi:hypothetical protein
MRKTTVSSMQVALSDLPARKCKACGATKSADCTSPSNAGCKFAKSDEKDVEDDSGKQDGD